jgi:hypothetical protein
MRPLSARKITTGSLAMVIAKGLPASRSIDQQATCQALRT